MTSVGHSTLIGDQLHVAFRWVQEGDPGSGADHPGHYWVKLSTGEIKRRKDDDSGWTLLGGTTGGVTAADFTAKGDVLVGTGVGTYGHLSVGADGYFIRAHSAAGDGLQYYDHEGAADPHPNYALDSDLAAYQAKSTLTAKGDLYVATASGVVTRLPVGTDGDVLTADSGATPGVSWQAGGGGGVTNLRTTYASRPAAGTAGRLWVSTDGIIQAFDDGAAWHEYFGSLPINASLGLPGTWVNQSTAAIDTTLGGIQFTAPAVAGDNFRLLVKAAPATPYTITVGLSYAVISANHNLGIGFRESGSGKFSQLSRLSSAVDVFHFTNPTTFSSTPFTTSLGNAFLPLLWLRIQDDGTNRIYSISADGIKFSKQYSEGRTSFLTADQVGIIVNTADAGVPVDAWFFSWLES